jgi:hypothetical protein
MSTIKRGDVSVMLFNDELASAIKKQAESLSNKSDDDFFNEFSDFPEAELIRLLRKHGNHEDCNQDDFEGVENMKYQEDRIQPTNPYFAKEKWRK